MDIIIPKIAKNQNFTAVTYVEPKFSDNLAGDKRGQGENPVFRITKKYVPLNR